MHCYDSKPRSLYQLLRIVYCQPHTYSRSLGTSNHSSIYEQHAYSLCNSWEHTEYIYIIIYMKHLPSILYACRPESVGFRHHLAKRKGDLNSQFITNPWHSKVEHSILQISPCTKHCAQGSHQLTKLKGAQNLRESIPSTSCCVTLNDKIWQKYKFFMHSFKRSYLITGLDCWTGLMDWISSYHMTSIQSNVNLVTVTTLL